MEQGVPSFWFAIKKFSNGELCLSCHENVDQAMASGSSQLHEPYARGECKTCHDAHSGDYSYMLNDRSGVICFSCHADVKLEIETIPVKHQPVDRLECVACHSAHGSSHGNNLVKGQPDLCTPCHQDVVTFWQEGVAHEPAKEDCTICHSSHGSKIENLLSSPKKELCVNCHEIGEPDFIKIHSGIKPGPTSCFGCHNPHGGLDKKLLYPFVHKPFAEGSCRPCHPGGAK